MYQDDLELYWNVEDFASLHNEMYRDDLELYWNSGTCKSASMSVYSVLEFGCTCNY